MIGVRAGRGRAGRPLLRGARLVRAVLTGGGAAAGAFALVVVATLVLPAATAGPVEAAAPAGGCHGGALQVVAHPDDDLLFQSPDVLRDVQAGRCVRTVYLTAGDAGAEEEYWAGREQGVARAYAQMAGLPDVWSVVDAGVTGRDVHAVTLDAAPQISLVFLRLPDGDRTGAGMPRHGHQSLRRLWEGDMTTMTAVDGSETYTAGELRDTVQALIDHLRPTTVRTLDWTLAYGTGDSADHTAAALITREAARRSTVPHTLLAYDGYPVWTRPPNVTGEDLQEKAAALTTYAADDPQMCLRPWCTEALVSSLRVGRQYVVATESATNAARWPGATVTASAENPRRGQRARSAVDGVVSGALLDRTREWVAPGAGAGAWIEVTLPEPTPVTAIVLCDRPNRRDRITSARLELSDGSVVEVGELPDNGSPLTVELPAVVTTSVRLVVTGVSRRTANIGLAEIEVHAG